MDVEWHVSDSEEEDEIRNFPTLSQKDVHNSLANNVNSIPRHLVSLYKEIANEGYVALNCPTPKRSLEKQKDECNTTTTAVVDTCQNISLENNDNKIQEQNKKKATAIGFDFEDELFDASVVFPRKTPKSAKKTKRVGTMENVIHDLNRFHELNTQVMEKEKEK